MPSEITAWKEHPLFTLLRKYYQKFVALQVSLWWKNHYHSLLSSRSPTVKHWWQTNLLKTCELLKSYNKKTHAVLYAILSIEQTWICRSLIFINGNVVSLKFQKASPKISNRLFIEQKRNQIVNQYQLCGCGMSLAKPTAFDSFYYYFE